MNATMGRVSLVLGLIVPVVCACTAGRAQTADLAPAPTPAELGLAAQALEDSSAAPVIPPRRLAEAVVVLRWAYRASPVTWPHGSELTWHPSLKLQMPDSLFRRLFDGSAGPSVDRWLTPQQTGCAPFDSVTAAVGGAVAIKVQGTFLNYGVLTVYYREPLNTLGLWRAYASLHPPVTISTFNGLNIPGGDQLRVRVTDSIWSVHVPAGWGDCPNRPDRRACELRYDPATGRIER